MKMQHAHTISLKARLLFLPLLFLIGLAILQFVNFYLERQVRQNVIFPNFEAQVIEGHKHTLKSAVQVEAAVLGARLKSLKSREEQVAAIVAETDPIRFFEDNSGYFFTYDLSGVRINVPINKSQNNQNLINAPDKKGFHYVEAFVNIAKAGGGFVEYFFEKEGKGVQPKLSYAMLIPGTDILIGTGVYIDNVESERASLAAKIEKQNKTYQLYTLALFLAIVAVTVTIAFLQSHSIGRTIRLVTDDMLACSKQVSDASGEMAATSQSLAEGANDQASSLEESGAALEELTSITKSNAQNAQKANDLARQAREAAEVGESDIQQMNHAMGAIKASSDEIAKIIKTIDEIAFQTNILALNAAVEAARAGESGMGFAVVAEEVRNLAQRSAQAARETAMKIEAGIDSARQGVDISAKVAKSLSDIVGKARQVDQLVREVSAASHEQTTGLAEINTAVGRIDQVTQSTAANAEESAAVAQELNAQAESMKALVLELMRLAGGDQRRNNEKT